MTGLIACLAALPALALSSVSLNGVYQGEIGQIELQTADGRVTGTYSGGGPCDFEPKRPILDGEFEGKVLVATLTLCQRGPSCEEHPYSILAFFHPEGGSLVADVKLESGCSSPALQLSRFILRPARPEEIKPVQPAAQAPGRKTRREECRKAPLDQGDQLFQRRDYAGALFYYERALGCDPQSWRAYLGLGMTELRRDRAERAVVLLLQARELAHKLGKDNPDIFYTLACARARQNDRQGALKDLTTAVDLGWPDPEGMGSDPDLQSLRDEPEFKALQDRVWRRKDSQQKEKAEKGEPL